MLLKNEINTVKEKIENIGIDKIKNYAIDLRKSKQYNNFETRLSFDVLHAIDNECFYVNELLYNKYGCKDIHIETLIKKILKELQII